MEELEKLPLPCDTEEIMKILLYLDWPNDRLIEHYSNSGSLLFDRAVILPKFLSMGRLQVRVCAICLVLGRGFGGSIFLLERSFSLGDCKGFSSHES